MAVSMAGAWCGRATHGAAAMAAAGGSGGRLAGETGGGLHASADRLLSVRQALGAWAASPRCVGGEGGPGARPGASWEPARRLRAAAEGGANLMNDPQQLGMRIECGGAGRD